MKPIIPIPTTARFTIEARTRSGTAAAQLYTI